MKNRIDLHVLEKARDHLNKPGQWYQGGYSEKGADGAMSGLPCCLIGSLIYAEPKLRNLSKLTPYLMLLTWQLRDEGMECVSPIVTFNDTPGRKVGEIIALLGRVIDHVRSDRQEHS